MWTENVCEPRVGVRAGQATVRVEMAGRSHIGRRRDRNEDRLGVLPRAGVLVVADGVGGYPGGDVAAQLAVEAIREVCENENPTGDPEATFRTGIALANARVREQARRDSALWGMATTLAAVCARPEGLWLTHIGDSRVLRYRGGDIERLTRDHSLRSDPVARGRYSRDELGAMDLALLTRVIGHEDEPNPDFRVEEVQLGDIVVVASDGLTGVVREDDIADILWSVPDLAAAVDALVDIANRRGGPDNITVALGKWIPVSGGS